MKILITLALVIVLVVGEVLCVYKFFTSDFNPSYKREAIYGFGAVSGLGCIIGYMDIEDTVQ
jgi:hypothetical protein